MPQVVPATPAPTQTRSIWTDAKIERLTASVLESLYDGSGLAPRFSTMTVREMVVDVLGEDHSQIDAVVDCIIEGGAS